MTAMPIARANGIDIAYETLGDPADPTVLLVHGLGCQLIEWDDELCRAIVDRGFHVVRFDNRDVGESTRFDQPVDVMGVIAAVAAGEVPEVPYLLSDMAADAVGLLDHLGVDRAHVLGVSMGGMIVQTMAIEHGARLRSMTSIMSTTGDPDVGMPTGEAMSTLLSPPPQTREELQDAAVRNAGVWGSPGLYDEARLREVAGRKWDRGYDPAGTARQLAAILASGSRSAGLATVDVPTLVIHGTADKLVQPSGGERTAEVVPDAKLLMIEGMGHDLPPPLWGRIVDAFVAHATEHP
jgi:pimeloyl-ACP methyl ester carboxylesterase